MDEIDVRAWALDRAIKEAPTGTIWENIFALADKYTRYILNGTWATPVADAAAPTKDFTGPGYEAHPGRDHEDCCK